MTGYRFNAQNAFVTYAKTKKLMTHNKLLKLVEGRAEIENYVISQERHKDGGYHLHGYFKFSEKLDRGSEGLFGWSYYNKLYMPHIESPRTKHKLWAYIKKSGVFITNIDETRPKWLVFLEDSTSEEEFLMSTMWEIGRINNFAGYKTYRDLWQIRQSGGLGNGRKGRMERSKPRNIDFQPLRTDHQKLVINPPTTYHLKS